MVFLPFRKKHLALGAIISSILVPVVNTGLFSAGCFTFFISVLEGSVSETNPTALSVWLYSFVGVNFIIELVTIAVLSPVLVALVKIIFSKVDIGSDTLKKKDEKEQLTNKL